MKEGIDLQPPTTHEEEYRRRIAKFFNYIDGHSQTQPAIDHELAESPSVIPLPTNDIEIS